MTHTNDCARCGVSITCTYEWCLPWNCVMVYCSSECITQVNKESR